MLLNPTLSAEEILVNSLGVATKQRNFDQIQALKHKLGSEYSESEIQRILKGFLLKLDTSDAAWLKAAIQGEELADVEVVPRLTVQESNRLAELEQRLDQNLSRFFLEVGEVLTAIKEEELWKEHGSWENYCEQGLKGRIKRDIGKNYADRLITATKTYKELRPCGPTGLLPSNEYTLRELSRVKNPEVRQQVWEEAVIEYGNPSVPELVEVRDRIVKGTGASSTTKPPANREPDATMQVLDLVEIVSNESNYKNCWGRIIEFSPDGSKVRVKVGANLVNFKITELEPERFVSKEIAQKVEELCASADPHTRDIAQTYTRYHQFTQRKIDLLGMLTQ